MRSEDVSVSPRGIEKGRERDIYNIDSLLRRFLDSECDSITMSGYTNAINFDLKSFSCVPNLKPL